MPSGCLRPALPSRTTCRRWSLTGSSRSAMGSSMQPRSSSHDVDRLCRDHRQLHRDVADRRAHHRTPDAHRASRVRYAIRHGAERSAKRSTHQRHHLGLLLARHGLLAAQACVLLGALPRLRVETQTESAFEDLSLVRLQRWRRTVSTTAAPARTLSMSGVCDGCGSAICMCPPDRSWVKARKRAAAVKAKPKKKSALKIAAERAKVSKTNYQGMKRAVNCANQARDQALLAAKQLHMGQTGP